jgi:AcrR family transcriptional regulator
MSGESVTPQPKPDLPGFSQSKVALIVAAERLFALNTIAGTSLRQIGEAAGQKNSAAVLYHFVSRNGIVRAILDYRMGPIDQLRRQMLDDLLGRSAPIGIRDLLNVLVMPAANELRPRDGGNYYFRFLHQLFRNPALLEELLTPHAEAWLTAEGMVKEQLRWLPSEFVEVRVKSLGLQNIFWMSSIENDFDTNRLSVQHVSFRVECAIDAMHASLIGPVSMEALAAAADAQVVL